MSLEHRHRELINGQRRGLIAALGRIGLGLLSLAYGLALSLRGLWHLLPFASRRADLPVISIGNLTTGGTGKTPMTAWVASLLSELGHRPAILLRGYRGRLTDADDHSTTPRRLLSDEADLLRRHCPSARVIVDADRIAGARRARAEGCHVIVLDDGFQHRRLRRDLDIVLIDATCPFGFDYLLPRGLLREPLRALRRASVLIVTRCDQANAKSLEDIERRLSAVAPGLPVLRARHEVTGFTDPHGRPIDYFDPAAAQAAVFAGIANFDSFHETLQRLGVNILDVKRFPDHHDYTDEEIAALPQWAANLEANALLTTEKDAVKLVDRWQSESPPLLVPRVRISFEGKGATELRDRITQTCASSSQGKR